MSWEKHKEAVLEGILPQFPESIDQLNEIYEKVQPLLSIELDEVFDFSNKNFQKKKIRTSDDYLWFLGITLEIIPTGSITIAFPIWGKYKGSERSIAFYHSPEIKQEYLGKLCLKVIDWFKEFYDS